MTDKYIPPAATLVALLLLALTSNYSYLLFHSLAELFGIVIAFGTFMLAWNARRFLDNGYPLFVGLASLFIALLALLHTLAYKGLGVFTDFDADLPTQLWLATRYVASLSFLLAPLFIRRRTPVYPTLIVYSIVTVLLLASIFVWDVFPPAFVEGQGQTAFKIASEYVISGLFLVSLAALYRHRAAFDPGVFRLLAASLTSAAVCEIAFTFYVDVYALSNLVGHLFNIASFYFLYRAIIETGLMRPYDLLFRELREAHDELEARVQERTAQLQTLSRRLVQVQENERRTIARELHDETGQSLTALKVGLALLEREGDCPPDLTPRIEDLKRTADEVLEGLHRVAMNLRPASLDRIGLTAALSQYIETFRRRSGLEVEFSTVEMNGERLPAEVETTLYRVVQEALTNVARHAHATRAEIVLIRKPASVSAVVEDNGTGFDPTEARRKGRLGLLGMSERAEVLGGVVTIDSEPGAGATVVIEIPCPSN